jgi:Protein of unknown function (DUF2785)
MLQALLLGVLVLQPGLTHDRAFWRAIVDHDNTPPAGTDVAPLVHELSSYLSSPDPALRDQLAYDVLVAWIYQKHLVTPALERELLKEWTANLQKDIGSTGTDAVLPRSFSALMLSVIVAHDNAAPFLESNEVHGLLTAALTYLNAEKDVRGYDPQKGWMHSAAHTADLLKFLARSRYLTVADQATILDAIARKLHDAPEVFTHGEDQRFARTVLAIVNRPDFDAAAFTAWVARTTPKQPTDSVPDPAVLNALQNTTNLFAKLEVLLTLQDPATPATTAARDALREVLKKLF